MTKIEETNEEESESISYTTQKDKKSRNPNSSMLSVNRTFQNNKFSFKSQRLSKKSA